MSLIALPTTVPNRRWHALLVTFALTAILAAAGWMLFGAGAAPSGPVLTLSLIHI